MGDGIQGWREADGDNTYALNWPLNENSLVWEIGGYEGRWVAQIADKFNPTIHVFEPQDWAVRKCVERFLGNQKVFVHPWGLWINEEMLPLYNYETDGASLINVGVRSQLCAFRDVYRIMKDEPKDIDLCLMNIEGAEFILLPYLIGLGMMERFRYFWCQFHPFLEYSDSRTARIYDGMSRTHDLLWNFHPTAVAWERKRKRG